jgi:hypothetical protein
MPDLDSEALDFRAASELIALEESRMTEPTIICPNCKAEIKLTESLAAPLIESTRKQFEQQLAQKDSDIAKREQAVRENENTNGLLRRYFPKGTDFRTITEERLASIVKKLNHRPRKCLGYQTPQEVFQIAKRGALGM